MWPKRNQPNFKGILRRAWLTWRYFILLFAGSYLALWIYPHDWLATLLVVLNVGVGVGIINGVKLKDLLPKRKERDSEPN